jgi:hypothetical protein
MMDLLQWWNLIFLLPLLCAAVYHLLLAVGAVATESDADADVEADTHLEAGGDGELDHGLEHSTLADHGHHGGDHGGGALGKALMLLGIGKVPLSIILVSWCYVWGVAGYASNQLLGGLAPGQLVVWPSILVAAAAAIVLTRFLAGGLSRVLPKTESYGVYTRDLVGRPAIVRYAITPTFGTAQVYDQHGTLHEVDCRVRPSEEPIPAGAQVALADYDEAKQVFIAVRI